MKSREQSAGGSLSLSAAPPTPVVPSAAALSTASRSAGSPVEDGKLQTNQSKKVRVAVNCLDRRVDFLSSLVRAGLDMYMDEVSYYLQHTY